MGFQLYEKGRFTLHKGAKSVSNKEEKSYSIRRTLKEKKEHEKAVWNRGGWAKVDLSVVSSWKKKPLYSN